MYCTNCGKELEDPSQGCQFCSSSQGGQDVSIAAEEASGVQSFGSEPQMSPKKGLNKKLKIALIIAAAVASISLVSFAATTVIDMLKSPKQLYMEVEKRQVSHAVDAFKESLKNKGQSKIEEPYKTNTELSLNAKVKNVPGVDDESVQSIEDELKNFKFSVTTTTDPVKNQAFSEYKLLQKGKELAGFSFFNNKKVYGLSIPSIYNKYFVIDGEDLASVYKNLGIADTKELPKKILNTKDILSAISIKDDDLDTLVSKYGRIYYDNINSENLTIEKNVDFDIDSDTVKCTKYSINLNEQEFKNLLLKISEAACEDDVLFNVIFDNIVNVLELYDDSGYFGSTGFKASDLGDKEKLKKDLKEGKKDLKEFFDGIDLPNGFKMDVYTDRSGDVVGRTINLTIGKGEESVNLVLDFKNRLQDDDNAVKSIVSCTISPKNESVKVIFTLDSLTSYTDSDRIKPKNSDSKLTFEISSKGAESFKVSISALLKQSYEYGVKMELPEMTSSNSVDLNHSSNEELKQALQEIQQSIINLFNIPRLLDTELNDYMTDYFTSDDFTADDFSIDDFSIDDFSTDGNSTDGI